MGGGQSTPDPPPDPSDSPTGTDTPSSTRTPTGTRTPSITPNISDATTYTMSVSAYTSRSPSVSSRYTVSRSPQRSPSTKPTTTGVPLILCGNNARYEGIWKTHYTAGAAPYPITNCLTVVYTEVGKLVQFTELSQDTNPCCDSVYIYDGPTISSPQLVHLFGTSRQYPYNWTSTSNSMTIQFTSFTSTTHKGLVASIEFLSGPSPTSSASPSQSSLDSLSVSTSSSTSQSPSVSAQSSDSSSGSQSLSSSVSVTFSQTASESESSSSSPSYSNTISESHSTTSSPSYSNTISESHSSSSSPSYSNTISNTHSTTGSPLASDPASQTPSYSQISISASTSDSSSPSSTFSPSPASSSSASTSPSISASGSPSGSPSQSSSTSQTISQIQTPSLLDTVSQMSTGSYSWSFSQKPCPSPQPSYTSYSSVSPSLSYSISGSTLTPSAFPTARPRGPPPPLPNLQNMSLDNLKDLLSDLSYYNPSQIQGSLNNVGFAAMQQSGGEFAASTSAFEMKMKAIDTSAAASMQVGSTNLSLPPLSSLGTGLAASMIQWTTNPHAALSSEPIDSPPLSLNILDSTGSTLSVKNLTTPISFNWALNTSDPKFQTPPFYFARCDLGQLYQKSGDALSLSTTATKTGKASWLVPCLLGLWKPLNCTDTGAFSIQTFQCPTPIFTPSCLYWSTSQSKWSTDGCITTLLNGTISCACTHLTDFTSRIDAMAEANKELFANAANVYSLSGLLQYAQWFGIFGGIAALTLLLGLLSMRIDTLTTTKYVKSLCQDPTIRAVFDNAPNTAIYTFDAKSTKSGTKIVKKRASVSKDDSQVNTKPLSLCQRVMQQHSRVQFLFRYDPRLARVFRLLALFTIQYHSLFITALFYGFTYGASGKEGMLWYDVLALSIITSLLNFPVVSIILSSLGKIGLAEFKYKFPLLNEEYMRRSRFEKYALKYLENKEASKVSDETTNDKDTVDKAEALAMMDSGGDEESLLDVALMYLCCKPPKDEDDESSEHKLLSKMSQKELLVKMITVFKAKYPPCEVYDSAWSYLPCHTPEAWIFLICSGGWLAWCLNYLLLFASSHPQSVGQEIMISYATSELSTVFITQPLTILITYCLFKLTQKYGLSLPLFIQRFVIIRVKKGVPPLFHFSNPWSHLEGSSLTSRFAYSLFVKCPAAASNTNELAYAPTKAIVHNDDHEELCPVEELYKEIMGVKAELELREI